jgi:hypothetical protein
LTDVLTDVKAGSQIAALFRKEGGASGMNVDETQIQ